MSACDRLATSETIADRVEDDEALESVDDDDTVDALDDELDDCSAASRLVRSVSSDDSKLLALDELSVELDELEVPETPDGGGPGGGPPAPPGPPIEAPLAEL